jgi:hypothetical protein
MPAKLVEEFCRHCAVVEAAEARCNTQDLHREWWAPGSAGRRKCGLAHIGMRLEESPGEVVGQCSRVEKRVEERSSMGELGRLKHLELEKVALGRHSLAQRPDEGCVKQLRLE